MSRKLALIAGVSLILLGLLGASIYFLYTSPSVGITTVWDKSVQHWRVESAEPWSLLRKGDLIKRIADIDIGPLHLLGCIKNLRDRNEALSWSEARTRLYEQLTARKVPFTIIRDSEEKSVILSPGMAGWSFLYGFEYVVLLTGFFSFAIGTVLLYKKGLNEQSLVLFLLCSAYFCCAVCYGASISHELVMEPRFDYLNTVILAVSNLISAVLILHVSLVLPARKHILDRIPKLLWPAYIVALLIGASLEFRALNAMMAASIALGLLILGHSFFSCRKPVEREQMRWIVAGFALGAAPHLGLVIIPLALTGQELVSVNLTGPGVCLIFLAIAFAIQKYRLMQIDAFLEGTFVYAVTIALLGAIDLGLMAFFSSRFAHALELRPTGRLFLALIITLSVYAVIRDKIRTSIRRLLGRAPVDEQATLLAFTVSASGYPPAAILRLLASCIEDAFKPKSVTLVEKGNGANEDVLSAFTGLTIPIPLWQSPLREKVPDGDSYFLALPLTRDGETDCVILLGELPGGRLYSTCDLGILRSLLREAKLLYENAWLYEENLKHCRFMIEEEKRHLREKEKIVRELHDGLGGLTTNIHLLSEIAAKSSSLPKIKSSLATISELSREGLAEIRTFMHSLDHENLTWPDLASDLKRSGAKIVEASGMVFELESVMSEATGRPGSFLFLNVLRIYREALTNIVKHSGATRVKVRLEVSPEKLLLSVDDNGKGLDADQTKHGRGLSHMRKRAADIGGVLSIQSDNGTRVQLEVKL